MESKKENNNTILNLTSNEALILFEWLSRFNLVEHKDHFKHEAEKCILFDLEAVLEKEISEIFSSNYDELILNAWKSIGDGKE